MQTAFEFEESRWTAPDFPDLMNADLVAIDTETCDPGLTDRGAGWARNEGHIAGVSVAARFSGREEIGRWYFPFGHETKQGCLAERAVKSFISDLCSTQIPKVFHNGIYDCGWLKRWEVNVRGPLHDTQVAVALLDEHRLSYGLDNCAKDYAGVRKDEALLMRAASQYDLKTTKAVKANMWRLPAKYVGPYAEQDAVATLLLWESVAPMLREQDLLEAYSIEVKLIPILVEMRMRGVRVDLDKAQEVRKALGLEIKQRLATIKRDTGVNLHVWEAASCAALFDHHGIPYPRTPKTGAPSFTKEFLDNHEHPIAQEVLDIRKLEKTKGTFIENAILNGAVNGRIHTEFHALKSDEGGAITGRFSSTNPNLQQVPARHPRFGPMVRGLFLPEEGCLWGAFDYSSQEPRLTVHYAELTKQTGGAEAGRLYRDDPKTDYHQMVADMCGIGRKPAKAINLGLAYGMGGAKLCRQLGLPTKWIRKEGNEWLEVEPFAPGAVEVAGEEGAKLLAQYHERVPFVNGLTTTCGNLAQDRGYIRTLGGRRNHFNLWEPVRGFGVALPYEQAKERYKRVRRAYTYRALNSLIQGSAADQTKRAMVAVYEAGGLPILQVHDELDIPVATEAEGVLYKKLMEECVQLLVPSVVDAEYGPTWGTATMEWNNAIAA